jgi:hypothetical protein
MHRHWLSSSNWWTTSWRSTIRQLRQALRWKRTNQSIQAWLKLAIIRYRGRVIRRRWSTSSLKTIILCQWQYIPHHRLTCCRRWSAQVALLTSLLLWEASRIAAKGSSQQGLEEVILQAEIWLWISLPSYGRSTFSVRQMGLALPALIQVRH